MPESVAGVSPGAFFSRQIATIFSRHRGLARLLVAVRPACRYAAGRGGGGGAGKFSPVFTSFHQFVSCC
jgi:hypothetical protein